MEAILAIAGVCLLLIVPFVLVKLLENMKKGGQRNTDNAPPPDVML